MTRERVQIPEILSLHVGFPVQVQLVYAAESWGEQKKKSKVKGDWLRLGEVSLLIFYNLLLF